MTHSLNQIPLLLILTSFAFAFTIEKSLRKQYLVITLVRLVFLALAITILTDSRTLSMYPDQNFYITTAESISKKIKVDGIFINYKSIVGLHNRSYNVIGGVLLFLNSGMNSVLVFRSLNFLLHSLIIILSLNFLQVYTKDKRNSFVLLIVLGLLPSFLIYSLLTLRELLLSLSLLLFIIGFVKKNLLFFILSIVLSYYTRMQLLMVYITAITLWFLLLKIKDLRVKTIYKILFLSLGLIFSAVVFTLIFPNYTYLSNHLRISNLFGFVKEFVIGLFGISFLFHSDSLELQTAVIFITKLLTPEVFIIPGLYIYYLIKTKFSVRSSILLNIILILYSFGYSQVQNLV